MVVIENYENDGNVQGSDNNDDDSESDLRFMTMMMTMAVAIVKMITAVAMVLDNS